MKVPFRLNSMVVAFGLAGSMLAGAAQAQNIKIGVVIPATGPLTQYGDMVKEGVDTALEQINAAGGINGSKLEAVIVDDACEPKQAVAVANRLVDQDKVVGVVGHFCSSNTIPASEVYDEAGILTITPGSTNPLITERGMKDMFRMCGRDDQQGAIAANYMLDVLKAKKIAVIHDKDTYGQGLADATRAALAKRGTKEVLYEGLSRGEKDFNALVTKIGALKPDVVYFGGCHPEAGPLVRQMREQGVQAKFFSGDCIVTEELVPTISLEDYCRDWPAYPPDVVLKRALLRRVAEMARRMHGGGVNHRDFYICHFLLHLDPVPSPANFKLSLIDLHRAQIRNKTPRRWRDKDLASLYFSALDIGLTQRDLLRFLRQYFDRPLRLILREEDTLLSYLSDEARRLQARYLRKYAEGESA